MISDLSATDTARGVAGLMNRLNAPAGRGVVAGSRATLARAPTAALRAVGCCMRPHALAATVFPVLLLASAAQAAAVGSAQRSIGGLATGNGEVWKLEDTSVDSGTDAWTFRRMVADTSGRVRYASRVLAQANRVDWVIATGHPSQRVSVNITPGLVIATDDSGRERWRAVPDAPVCLPELMAEFAVQSDAQARSNDGLRCVTPIDKARKLAPLRLRRLADAGDGSRVYEVGPGSLGMRLFFGRQVLRVSADGRELLAASGQFEVARALQGRLRYANGELRYARSRPLQRLPPMMVAVKRPQ